MGEFGCEIRKPIRSLKPKKIETYFLITVAYFRTHVFDRLLNFSLLWGVMGGIFALCLALFRHCDDLG